MTHIVDHMLLLELVGNDDDDRESTRIQETENRYSYLMLYAGAQWHPRCQDMQGKMLNLVASCSDRSLPCKFVYLSNDIRDDETNKSIEMLFSPPWRLLRDETAAKVMRLCGITSIPSLLVLKAENGQFLAQSEWPSTLRFEIDKEFDESLPVWLSPTKSLCPSSSSIEDTSSLFAAAIESYDRGLWSSALHRFVQVLEKEPRHAGAAFNVAVALQMLGLSTLAVYYAELSLQLNPDDVTAHVLLGDILVESERDAVIAAYRRLEGPRAQHRLAILTGEGESAKAASKEYVQQVFDELAESFEDKLVSHLQYRVPWHLYDLVSQVRPLGEGVRHSWRIVDLGCGTGLCGKLFEPYCGGKQLVGVDLSTKMLARARDTGAYHELKALDIHEALIEEEDGRIDLILSADTFIYVGDLERCFSLVSQKLAPGGFFSFSIEMLLSSEDADENLITSRPHDDASCGFKLINTGRYAHCHKYIDHLRQRHSLQLIRRRDIDVRLEQTRPIRGAIYLLQKKD